VGRASLPIRRSKLKGTKHSFAKRCFPAGDGCDSKGVLDSKLGFTKKKINMTGLAGDGPKLKAVRGTTKCDASSYKKK